MRGLGGLGGICQLCFGIVRSAGEDAGPWSPYAPATYAAWVGVVGRLMMNLVEKGLAKQHKKGVYLIERRVRREC